MPPMEATSAEVEPETPANSMDARMLTCARPPGIKPTSSFAKPTMRLVTPQAFMISPAKMNSGIAIRVKESPPAKMRWVRMTRSLPFRARYSMEEMPTPNATGTPISSIRKKIPMIIHILHATSHVACI